MPNHNDANESAKKAQEIVGHPVSYYNGGIHSANGVDFSDSYGKIKKGESSDRMTNITGLKDPETLSKSKNA